MVSFEAIAAGHPLFDKMTFYRDCMVTELANYCEELEEQYLTMELNEISQEAIHSAVRKAIVSEKMVPLLCGSALKNKGVQPLLDGVVQYLPSPLATQCFGLDVASGEKALRDPNPRKKLSALAFKVVNDKEKGMVTFFRVY